ncbi:hypothetical protein [Clostridium sp. C2-6-12]|uniref:hypothetical protein n=1 Tax=Clostridium sp. C2-6-12 TaxID=2698832 RepID=UPI00136C0CDA|nr:hypothetical protein [Clostridium sp. C2-6-12]
MIDISCQCEIPKKIHVITNSPGACEAVVECESCGQKYYSLLFERMGFGSDDILEIYEIPICEEEFQRIKLRDYKELELGFLRDRKARLIFDGNISEISSNLALERCGRN